MTKKRILMLLGSVCLALVLALPLVASCAAPTPTLEFPERDIRVICPWGAGGGTDAISRNTA